MRAIAKLRGISREQAQIKLMHKRGGLERVASGFIAKVVGG